MTRGDRGFSLLFLALLLGILVFASGCTGQESGAAKNASGNTTGSVVEKAPSKAPETARAEDTVVTGNSSGPLPQRVRVTVSPQKVQPVTTKPGNQMYISDIEDFLSEWNGYMEWGFSSEEIAGLNKSLRSGFLKKFEPDRQPRSIANHYNIPDMYTFCLELGGEIGLTRDQSEVFARKADGYYSRGKIAYEGGVPTKHFLTFDHCAFTLVRGQASQINMTYTYEYPDPPETIRFNKTGTPLELTFSPTGVSRIKSFHEYPASVRVTADPSLQPGQYQFRVTIDGVYWTEMHCRDMDTENMYYNILAATVV